MKSIKILAYLLETHCTFQVNVQFPHKRSKLPHPWKDISASGIVGICDQAVGMPGISGHTKL